VAAEANDRRRAADAALSAALGKLPAEDRLILRLRYWDGASVADIARHLSVPQKPLYRRIDRALSALRTHLELQGISRDDARALLDDLAPAEVER